MLRDDMGLAQRADHLKQPVRFHHLFLDDSRKKAALFLGSIRRNGAAFEWEMNLPVLETDDTGAVRQQMCTLHFAGGIVGRQICILGATVQEEVSRFFEEFLELTSEQAEILGTAVRDGRPLSAIQNRGAALYEDFSRLNNELVNAQRTLYKKNADLKRLSDEKSMMVGMAAHDLRNPLGVIMTYAECLAEELAALQQQLANVAGVDSGLIDMAQSIGRSSSFMLALVEQLLDLSKIESGTMELEREPLDPAAFVTENVRLNRVLARAKHVGIEFATEPDLPAMEVDPHKFTQVLNNLITNAVKFSPLYGDVIVAISCVRNGADSASCTLMFSVADRGPGIPEDKRDTIFQPFARLKGQQGKKGAGLGLAIARKIIRAHHGDIAVEDNPGGGARFVVRIPVQDAPTLETQAVAETSAGDISLNGMTVVVADDDAVSRLMLVRVLEKAGATVQQADGGEALLTLLPEITADVVVCDVHMPEVDGHAVLARIRGGQAPGVATATPILAVTGEQLSEVQAAEGPQFDGVLQKPVSKDDLLRSVAALR